MKIAHTSKPLCSAFKHDHKEYVTFNFRYQGIKGRIITVIGIIHTEHPYERVAKVFESVKKKVEKVRGKEITTDKLKGTVKHELHHKSDLIKFEVINQKLKA